MFIVCSMSGDLGNGAAFAIPKPDQIFQALRTGIACDSAGLRVGGVDLLEPDPAKARGWRARPDADLNLELSPVASDERSLMRWPMTSNARLVWRNCANWAS
jgi:hypothetical protein